MQSMARGESGVGKHQGMLRGTGARSKSFFHMSQKRLRARRGGVGPPLGRGGRCKELQQRESMQPRSLEAAHCPPMPSACSSLFGSMSKMVSCGRAAPEACASRARGPGSVDLWCKMRSATKGKARCAGTHWRQRLLFWLQVARTGTFWWIGWLFNCDPRALCGAKSFEAGSGEVDEECAPGFAEAWISSPVALDFRSEGLAIIVTQKSRLALRSSHIRAL